MKLLDRIRLNVARWKCKRAAKAEYKRKYANCKGKVFHILVHETLPAAFFCKDDTKALYQKACNDLGIEYSITCFKDAYGDNQYKFSIPKQEI